MSEQLSKILDLPMKDIFPFCIKEYTYGTTLFWAEEYWAINKILELERKYPSIDFVGLINTNFKNQLNNLLNEPPHSELVGTTGFADLSSVVWKERRKFINIATSHAPSRFIARKYSEFYDRNFGIISIDAHLDLHNTDFIHSAWISTDLMPKTAVIGSWAESKEDIDLAKSLLAFLEPNVNELFLNSDFIQWLSGKKIYLTLDLDYFRLSQHKFMGYSNYWHRNKIIGHSMNISQLLEKYGLERNINHIKSVGILLGIFSNLESFLKEKKSSIKLQSKKIEELFRILVEVCSNNATTLLSIDFVEYSPICDYQKLTLKELEMKYQAFHHILCPIKEV
ncbi:MAG: hypothetical protein ACFFAU_05445 [Candidatus Hodarchaeota archaeon]